MKLLDHGAFDRALLSAEHEAIMHVATQLLAASERDPIDIGQVSALRWRLAHLLARHLAREDRCLYPVLGTHADPDVAAMATAFAAEMGGLAGAYRAYMDRWNADAIMADPGKFAADTRIVIDALAHRVDREEYDLYPLLGAGSANAAASASTAKASRASSSGSSAVQPPIAASSPGPSDTPRSPAQGTPLPPPAR